MIASTIHDLNQPVRAIVRRAWFASTLRRTIESLIVGIAAHLTCLAAAASSGAEVTRTDVWVVAGAAAVFAASAWWLEHSQSEAAVARTLDDDGAIVTAYECELRGARSALQSLLSAHVSGAWSASGRRIARAPSALIVAVALAAGGLLALALESGPAAPSPVLEARRDALAQRARSLAEAVETEAGSLPSGVAEETREIARAAASIATSGAAPSDAAALSTRARETAREAGEHTGIGRELLATASSASELSAAVAGGGGTQPGSSGLLTDSTAQTTSRSQVAGGTPSPDGSAASGTPMPDASPDVTMFPPDPRPTADAPAERGLPAVRWWPRRFDAIVERWVEQQRTATDR